MKYKIWNKTEDIFTLGIDENGKAQWTAEEYINQKAPWASIQGVKVIVGNGVINGTCFMEFEATKEHYKNLGADINDNMTDDEVLQVMEDFENTPQEQLPAAEERIAAALEFNNILNM